MLKSGQLAEAAKPVIGQLYSVDTNLTFIKFPPALVRAEIELVLAAPSGLLSRVACRVRLTWHGVACRVHAAIGQACTGPTDRDSRLCS